MKLEILNILIDKIRIGQIQHNDMTNLIKDIYKSDKYDIFKSTIDNADENWFIKDRLHGISHNERVALLSMIIGLNEGFDSDELKILIKAAMYHDIGRTSASGKMHGIESARIVEQNKSGIADFDMQDVNMFEICNSSKNDFFRIYENYKNGKINPENILITDLIQLELMLKEEQAILNKKVKEKEKVVKKQDQYINELVKQIEILTSD